MKTMFSFSMPCFSPMAMTAMVSATNSQVHSTCGRGWAMKLEKNAPPSASCARSPVR